MGKQSFRHAELAVETIATATDTELLAASTVASFWHDHYRGSIATGVYASYWHAYRCLVNTEMARRDRLESGD